MSVERLIRCTKAVFAASISENIARNFYYDNKYKTYITSEEVIISTVVSGIQGTVNVIFSPILVPFHIHRAVKLRRQHWSLEEICDPNQRRGKERADSRLWYKKIDSAKVSTTKTVI